MSESPRQEADDSTSTADKVFSECPTCGRDDFKGELGVKLHHAKTHGESLVTETKTCEHCGSEYTVEDSWKAERSRFCSTECRDKGVERRSPNKVTVTCDNCGEDFERREHLERENSMSFCDQECHGEWLSGENHHNWKGGKEKFECYVCGDEVMRYAGTEKMGKREHVVCSLECNGKLISEIQTGEDHPMWRGGGAAKSDYNAPWSKNREKALERDEYKCRACGLSNEESKDKYGIALDVHHITPVREYEEPKEAHKLKNLVTACRACHKQYEGLPVFPDRKD